MPLELIVALVAVVAFFAIEIRYIMRGEPTISQHVREAYLSYPAWGFLAGLVLGLLLGHFFWFI